ncbi:hypothetical protein JW921_08195, partial [Candidatus Fermentibacterales bacterium]|nr:hypothetical protein [Candidatus Fermentibacterales bacterium]
GAATISLVDPLTGSLERMAPSGVSEGWALFDLESSRSWLLSRAPFPVIVSSGPQGSGMDLEMGSRRPWLEEVSRRLGLRREASRAY